MLGILPLAVNKASISFRANNLPCMLRDFDSKTAGSGKIASAKADSAARSGNGAYVRGRYRKTVESLEQVLIN